MKHNDSTQPATKGDLEKLELATKEELKKFATKEDLKSSELSMKKYIDKRFENAEKLNQKYTKIIVDEAKTEIEDKMVQFRDMIIIAIDPLLRELEERRQDREVGANQYYRVNQQLDNHEVRITKLEHA